MLNRDDSKEALARFDIDVLPRLIAGGISVVLPDGWRREWVDEYHYLVPTWKCIVFDGYYGEMPMRIEIRRDSEDDYRFTAIVRPVAHRDLCVWSIEIWPMRGIVDRGFEIHKIMNPEFYSVPF